MGTKIENGKRGKKDMGEQYEFGNRLWALWKQNDLSKHPKS